MQFYTGQHKFYCGIDLHTPTMNLCVLDQAGKIVLHRNMKAAPEPILKAITPYREDLVVCVEGSSPGTGSADLCAQRRDSLRPGPCALYAGHPRRQGQERPD